MNQKEAKESEERKQKCKPYESKGCRFSSKTTEEECEITECSRTRFYNKKSWSGQINYYREVCDLGIFWNSCSTSIVDIAPGEERTIYDCEADGGRYDINTYICTLTIAQATPTQSRTPYTGGTPKETPKLT